MKSVRVADFLKREKVQGKEIWQADVASPRRIIDLQEEIYEVAAKGGQIMVRTLRKIYTLSPHG